MRLAAQAKMADTGKFKRFVGGISQKGNPDEL